LGLRNDLHDRCVALSNDIATWLGDIHRPPDRARVAQNAIRELEGYFAETIAERRSHRQEDLLDLLLNPAEAIPMSDEELAAQCVMLLFAGLETTRNLIGNGLFTLLNNPDARCELIENENLMPSAIEELLRYESPLQGFVRGVRADIEVEGTQLRAGSSITFMIGAAHRDSREFPDPD
jgi:cytochrome P450